MVEAGQQFEQARKPLDDGRRREEVAGVYKVGRVTIYTALLGILKSYDPFSTVDLRPKLPA